MVLYVSHKQKKFFDYMQSPSQWNTLNITEATYSVVTLDEAKWRPLRGRPRITQNQVHGADKQTHTERQESRGDNGKFQTHQSTQQQLALLCSM